MHRNIDEERERERDTINLFKEKQRETGGPETETGLDR